MLGGFSMKFKRRNIVSIFIIWIIIATMLFGCGSAISETKEEFDQQVKEQTEKAQALADELQESILSSEEKIEEPTSTPTSTSTPTPEPTPVTGDMAVHFLDVGQGLSILVQSGGENLIYDGGDRGASSFVVSYLKKQGIETIDYLISSHYDEDHLAGLIGCLNAFNVETVIGSNYEHDSQLYQSFIDTVSTKGLEIQYPAVGTEYEFGTGKFTVLSPAEIVDDSNANSVAIKLENGQNSFVFTGDAEYNSEAAMCTTGIDLSCDVLVPGHHGSATATSWEFLEATIPEYAVISCGADNQYGHPDQDTMDKLSSMEISVFRTDKQGTIIAVSNGTDISWNTEPCNDYSSGDISDTGTQPPVTETPTQEPAPEVTEEPVQSGSVWLSATGSKYHSIPDCGNMNPNTARQISRADAEAQGYEACKKCW